MRSQLRSFLVGPEVYNHFIDTDTDATFLERDKDGVLLYKVTSDAYLFSGSTMIGRFHLNADHTWLAVLNDGREFDYKSRDLLATETKLFKELLKV